jgi:hypothetical protein
MEKTWGHQIWPCCVCGNHQVHSNDKETGSFCQMEGIEHPNYNTDGGQKLTCVIFAVCIHCKISHAIEPCDIG